MRRPKHQIILKVLSPRIVMKAINSFDRVMALIVGTCWIAAAVMLGFALYTVNLSVSAKHAAEAALVAEPQLPKIAHKKVEPHDVQALVDRLQHRFPNLTITFQNTLNIGASDGLKFHDWLSVLAYVDTVSPQIHWVLQQFCVGKCGGDLMQASLMGEKISFEKAQPETKK